jgi:hypothetical protein
LRPLRELGLYAASREEGKIILGFQNRVSRAARRAR